MRTVNRTVQYIMSISSVCSLVLVVCSVVFGQQAAQLPSPSGFVSDFAGVIDAQTKGRLEGVLQNLNDRTKLRFYVATVEETNGLDIFDYSHQLATQWKIGARTSNSKSLLLVVSTVSKTSFTQFSRLAQSSLPEGVLGEMAQRMKTPLAAGQFSEAIESGVQLFVAAVGEKLGLAPQELETSAPRSTAQVTSSSTEPTQDPSPATEAVKTRPRVVKETAKQSETQLDASTTKTEAPPEVPAPNSSSETKEPNKEVTTKPASVRNSLKSPKVTTPAKKTVPPVDDEAEAEEVELTLTLPLAKRAEKLKSFLETHPESKARPRAIELLISTHAGLGDQYLKSGDVDNGVQQLMRAIEESDTNISDKLFTGVIAQIPSNLYLRGQGEAAMKAAANLETKFASDPKRLLTIAGFYIGIERGDEAIRIAEMVVKLAPDMAEAHRVLALGHHINLQLDEAASEYKKTIEIDRTSRISRSSLADLTRARGNTEEALALYEDLLKTDANDRAATAGRVICLFELGRNDEATAALEAALAAEPKNLALLSGMAYWLAAHQQYEKAFDLARKAVEIEPRYTWAQIALVRSLIGLKRPTGAERAMRFARQYGKFPTLTYELANVVATMGFYDEAAEILRESFTYKDGQIETLLAGRIPARNSDFIELLGPERQASIYQRTAPDSAASSKTLKDLLALDTSLTQPAEGEKLNETVAADAAREFGSGNDPMRTFRQTYAANRLLKKTIALPTALELVQEARKGLEDALNVSVATTAVQADEFRNLRAQAIAGGTIPEIADAPRSALSNIMMGRLEDMTGWILFNQDKYSEGISHLKKASATLPNGTPAWRNNTWHLGVAYEQVGNNEEALDNYIKSYNTGERDPIRRAVIEKLYRKVNGSVAGLDDKIGPGFTTGSAVQTTESTPTTEAARPLSPEATAASLPTSAENKKTTETSRVDLPKQTTPEPVAEPTPTPTPTAPQTTSTVQPEPVTEEALRAASSRVRASIRITGRVLDSKANGLGNVVVVLISPSGSVLASTTDKDGNYSFTVMPAQKTYRVIPSKDGYTFSPVDRAFAGLIDDQKNIDFIGTGGP